MTQHLGVMAEIRNDAPVIYGGEPAEYANVDIIYDESLYLHIQRLLQVFPDVDSPALMLASSSGHLCT